MRIAITGATGNVGTAVVRALVDDPDVEEIVGIARRVPSWDPPRTRWVQADMVADDLRPHLAGVDVVIHLAWLIQPSRDRAITETVNVEGSRRVFVAAVDAGVPALVHASSVAAYSPADTDEPVDESYATGGVPTSYYSQQKVAVERLLDDVERRHPEVRVARLRPGLIFQRSAASQIRRLFAGPLVPGWVARTQLIPFVPQFAGLGGQVVHSDDIAQAYRLAAKDEQAAGAFNIGANPPLDPGALAHLLGARAIPIPGKVVRGFVDATWRARLHPVSPDWLDVAASVPVMLTDRARNELGWRQTRDPGEVLLELLDGLRHGAGFPTPPLREHAGGPFRVREFLSGVGGANPPDRRSGDAVTRRAMPPA